jgi:hypothetical protein
MPVQITTVDGVVHLVMTGIVTNLDLEAGVALIKPYENGPVVPHRLTDLSGAEGLNLNFESVWSLASKRRGLKFPNVFKSAIVAPKPSQMGFARMFQTLNDNPQITIQIFPDRVSALQWIAS